VEESGRVVPARKNLLKNPNRTGVTSQGVHGPSRWPEENPGLPTRKECNKTEATMSPETGKLGGGGAMDKEKAAGALSGRGD